MKIGLVSDTHGREQALAAALSLFADRQCRALVHCGDVGSVECLRLLGSTAMQAYATAGNMDRHLQSHLAETAEQSGVVFSARSVELQLADGRWLAATHGHDERLLRELVLGREFSYVCCGHSHARRDERHGGVRIINPGALHRARPHSAAVLDTLTDRVEFLDIPG
jgi:hypothetical protein